MCFRCEHARAILASLEAGTLSPSCGECGTLHFLLDMHCGVGASIPKSEPERVARSRQGRHDGGKPLSGVPSGIRAANDSQYELPFDPSLPVVGLDSPVE